MISVDDVWFRETGDLSQLFSISIWALLQSTVLIGSEEKDGGREGGRERGRRVATWDAASLIWSDEMEPRGDRRWSIVVTWLCADATPQCFRARQAHYG